MQRVKIQTPATSANLGSGFDSLGLALSFNNTIEVQKSDKHIMQVYGEGSNNPRIQANTMFLSIFEAHYKLINNGKIDTFKFTFQNNVPISRGMGSSSIVILSAIFCAYLISDVKISKNELLNMALKYEKHADNITPAVYGGFCVSSLYQNKVIHNQTQIPNSLSALLVIPSRPMSTKMSRQILPAHYKKEDVAFNISRSSLMVSAFMSGNYNLLNIASQDRIHEKYRMQTFPELNTIVKNINKHKPLMCTLSGSGSTIFSIFYTKDIKHITKEVRQYFPKNLKIVSCGFDNNGIRKIS